MPVNNKNLKPKFDTCFFERYAKITLETVLGDLYADLVNRDRPDLQMDDGSLGIEVTRAMKESKVEAIKLLNEMAAYNLLDVPSLSKKDICNNGYLYGLTNSDYVGHAEYEYWLGATPLRRVITNKVNKVINNFYGDFDVFGLYIFTKDDIFPEDLLASMKLVMDLQEGCAKRFKTLYISEIQNLYVCDISSLSYDQYHISKEMCQHFFRTAFNNQ